MTEHRRKRVGLALGGGVARGLAHIGVLEVLIREGIPIDFVAGASAGAIMGAVYCTGADLEKVREVALTMRWWKLASLTWPVRGVFSFDKMEKWIIAQIGDLRFEDLKVPFAVMAADLEDDHPVTLTKGRLAPAIHASCTVPGIIAPIRIDGHLLADGSLRESVPVSTVRAMGAEYVIGVDIFIPKLRREWGVFGHGFTALEMLVRNAGNGREQADCTITPDLAGKTYLCLSKGKELIALGKQAAESKMACIKEALNL